MSKYKVVMTFPDGEVIDSYEEDGEEGVFDTEQEAEDYFTECMSNYKVGGEVLHYPLEMVEQEPDYEIVEI